MNKIILKSKENLSSSVIELEHAVSYLSNYLLTWGKRLEDSDYLFSEEKILVEQQYKLLQNEIAHLALEIDYFKDNINNIEDEQSLEVLITNRKKLYARIRVCLSQFASLMTCLNWQSPSVKSSLNTRVGIEISTVKADWNDYKRDRSEDTFYCESLLEKNLLKSINTGVEPVLNIFNSGMGAFTSIVYFLTCENIVKNKILASSQIYVESRMLLKEFFKNNLETFDFNNTDLIIEKILKDRPNAVFIESLSNTNNLRLFDVRKIVEEVSKKYTEGIYFIIDVTCSMGFENIFDNFKIPSNIKIILHGSILKATQLGLERVNAGFVQTFGLGELSDKILDYRTLSGTNIQDFATYLLPFTNKSSLQRRMKIIESNAIDLAKAMIEADPNHEIFQEIVYPSIESHEDFELAKKIGFSGSFFNIKFIHELNNDKYFEVFTKAVIDRAKVNNCDIVHGASFGFNHTSIYYSVGWDEPENHYIRISTGTETEYEVEKIKKSLIEAFYDLKEFIHYENSINTNLSLNLQTL